VRRLPGCCGDVLSTLDGPIAMLSAGPVCGPQPVLDYDECHVCGNIRCAKRFHKMVHGTRRKRGLELRMEP